MPLHLPTVLLFGGLLAAAVMLGMTLLALRERRDYLWHWTAALISTVVGMLLFGLRGIAPDLLTVVLANMLLLGNLLFTLTGYQRLFGLPLQHKAMASLAVVMLLALFWLTYGEELYAPRVLVFNGTLAAVSVASAGLLWRQRRRMGWSVLALPVCAHSLQAALGLVRIAVTLQEPVTVGTHMMAASPVHVLAIMLNSFAAIALAFGMLALHAAHLLEELDAQASTDPLTGLSNRRGFEPALLTEWRRYQRLGEPLSALIIDIDHFKRINDQHGHAAGDAALLHLARVMGQQLRPYDLCARLGGEEFCVVLCGVDLATATRTAERLRGADLRFGRSAAGEPIGMTISVGVTCARAGDARPEAMLSRADRALYQAKAEGRDRVVTV